MSDTETSRRDPAHATREELQSALFAQMVIQQANLAMMLMGKMPHPQTGQTMQDLESARMFIDQLEMLQVKTKGNLTREEEQLLKQSLLSLQMGFVESVEAAAPKEAPAPGKTAPPPAAAEPTTPPPAESKPAAEGKSAPDADADSKKKFTKKY